MSLVDTAEIGRKGGENRAANMTAKQRSAAASLAAKARWAAYRAQPKKKAAKKRGTR